MPRVLPGAMLRLWAACYESQCVVTGALLALSLGRQRDVAFGYMYFVFPSLMYMYV